jgi:hypothetical protein
MELKILDILPIIIIIGIGVVACVGALYFSDNLGMLNAVHPVSNVIKIIILLITIQILQTLLMDHHKHNRVIISHIHLVIN